MPDTQGANAPRRPSDRFVLPLGQRSFDPVNVASSRIDFMVCGECGALLRAMPGDLYVKRHDDWHDSLMGFALDFLEHDHD